MAITLSCVERKIILTTSELNISQASSDPAIAEALQPFVDHGELAGAVALVADRDKILSIDAVGWADIAARKPMQADSMVWIASQSKPFTATALMMLAEEGLVDLDAPLDVYLPEFKGQWATAYQDGECMLLKKPAHEATVRDTLCHIIGMCFSTAIETPTLDALPLEVAVRSYAMSALQWEPGVRYAYSNEGINTAGRIVELVSGMKFERFLDERIIWPLGLSDTTFFPSVAQEARIAKAYRPNEARTALEEFRTPQLTYPLSGAGRYPMPAGGLFSTAGDVARFCQMALNEGEYGGRRYISAATHREMIRRQTPMSVPESCGLGWHVSDNSFGHGGALATNMWVHCDVKGGRIIVWLPQSGGYLGDGDQAFDAFKSVALGS
jgi:CubicO group peptidase (beta-lactamase class C family)